MMADRRIRNAMAEMESMRQKMRSEQNRGRDLYDISAGPSMCSTMIKVNNAGEATATFMFSCKFAQQPSVNFGYQMQSAPPSGRTPIFSASVKDWITIKKLPNGLLYAGAVLLIISEAADGVSFYVNATASGIAFRGPVEYPYV
jgi:hypothetical protein